MSSKPATTVTLNPIQPFNFGLSSTIYTRSEIYTHAAFLDGTLYKCIEVEGKPSLITIREEDGILKALLYGLGGRELLDVTANWLISSDLDLKVFYSYRDPMLESIIRRLQGLKPPRTASVYEALIIAYTEQQISLRVSLAFQERIVKRYGDKLQHGALTFYSFPTPVALGSVDVNELRGLGLSRNKANYITELSRSASSGDVDLESLKTKSTAEAREVLLSIRGVGGWTSDYFLFRGLGRTEMVPYDDLGTQDSVGLYFKCGVRATRGEVREILSRFGNYARLANYYLIYARFFGIDPVP